MTVPRFLAFLHNRQRKNVPCVPIVVADHAAKLAGVPLRKACQNAKILSEVLTQAYEHYRQDLLVVFSDVSVEAEAMGVRLHFPEDQPPYPVEFPELRELQPADPAGDGRLPLILEAARTCQDQIGRDVPIAVAVKDPFSLAAQLIPSQEFYRNCLKNPEQNHQLLSLALETQTRFVAQVLQAGHLPLIGAPFSSGSLISPGCFREFVSPYLQPLFAQIREAGQPVMLHICGDTQPIFHEILRLQPDVFSCDRLDLTAAVRENSYKVLFMGNLSTEILLHGDEQDIFSQTRKLLESVPVPFIPASACDVPANTPPANVLAMIRAVAAFREAA